MKFKLEMTIPGNDTTAIRKQIAAILTEVAKELPNHSVGSGQCYDHNGKDCGLYFLSLDAKGPETESPACKTHNQIILEKMHAAQGTVELTEEELQFVFDSFVSRKKELMDDASRNSNRPEYHALCHAERRKVEAVQEKFLAAMNRK